MSNKSLNCTCGHGRVHRCFTVKKKEWLTRDFENCVNGHFIICWTCGRGTHIWDNPEDAEFAWKNGNTITLGGNAK